MIRKATLSDSKTIWEWRNDETTCKMSFDTAIVPWENHQGWFERSLENPNRKLFIYSLEKDPIAVVRLDIEGETAEVSINVSPEQRGKGHGSTVIREIAQEAKKLGLKSLIAKIKPENTASLYSFAKVGFVETEKNEYNVLTLKL